MLKILTFPNWEFLFLYMQISDNDEFMIKKNNEGNYPKKT